MNFFNRTIFCGLLFLLFLANSHGQENVFLLIDVSGNPLNAPAEAKITPAIRSSAINLAEGIISGKKVQQIFPEWEENNLSGFVSRAFSGSGSNIIKTGSILGVFPYGDRLTYENFRIFTESPGSPALSPALDYARTFDYSDQLTFENLAIAMTARTAMENGIQEYILIKISGLGGDQTGSQPLTLVERSIMDDFESGADITSLGSFRYSDVDKEFALTIKRVNISTLVAGTTPPGGTGNPPTPAPAPPRRPKLSISSPKGSKAEPAEIDGSNPVSIRWRCQNCPPETRVTVTVKNLQSNKQESQTISGKSSVSFDLPPGKYMVQASSNSITSPPPQYFKVKGSGGGGILLFFLFAGLLVGAFFLLKKNDPFNWFDKKATKQPEDPYAERPKYSKKSANTTDNDSNYF